MKHLRSHDVPAMAVAIVVGAGLTLVMFMMISLFTASRTAIPTIKPRLIVNLTTWQPAEKPPAPTPRALSTPEPAQPRPPITQTPVPTRTTTPLTNTAQPPTSSQQHEAKPPTTLQPHVAAPLAAPANKATVAEDTLPVPAPLFQLTEMPRFLHRKTPVYPDTMRVLGKTGVVKVEALIDDTGKVRRVTILQSAGEEFDQAAKKAMMASSFAPGEIDGRPVTVLLRLPVTFQLL